MVEVPVEIDFITHDANPTVPHIPFGFINPGVRDMGMHLALEKGIWVFTQGHALSITQLGIRLGSTLLGVAYVCRLVPFRKSVQNCRRVLAA